MAQTKQSTRTSEPRPKDKKAGAKPCRLIRVDDLRVGMRIATAFLKPGELPADAEFDSIDELLAYVNTYHGRMATASTKVEAIAECEGKWRTHIHVNRTQCYDLRGRIWVIA